MTINTTSTRIDYAGNGVTTSFPVPFVFFGQSEIRVIERLDSTGTETLLTLGAQYTVTGGDGAAGTVVASTAPAAGRTWIILRNTARTQLVDYVSNDGFPAETHERALDRLAATVQEIERDASRSAFRIPETESPTPLLPSAATRANKAAGFDSSGAPTVLTLDPQGSIESVIAAGSTTARTLQERFGEIANVRDYGAVGDGVANDTAALQAAMATGKPVYMPPGTYRITGGLTFASSGQRLVGAGQNESVILPQGNFNVLTAPSPLDHVGAFDFTINAIGMSGGYCLNSAGADRVEWRRIRINDPWRVAYVYETNVVDFDTVYVQTPRGGIAFFFYGEDPVRSDVIRMRDVNVGSSTKNWTGIYWDGFASTIQAWGVTLVNSDRGLHVVNTGGGTIPQFGIFNDLEVDFCAREAVRIEAGAGYWFDFLYAQGSDTTELVYIGPSVNSVRINHGYIRAAYEEGIVVEGQDVVIANTQLVFNSSPAANYFNFDAARVTGTAQRVTFSACNLGQLAGIGTTVRYGATIESGARSIRFVGCDFSGCLLGAVLDSSGSTTPGNVEIVANHAVDQPQNESVAGFDIGVQDGSGALLTPTIAGGQITAVAVSAGGSEYTIAPNVVAFDPLGTGSGFLATATISGGAVTAITVTNQGTNYSAGTRVVARSAARVPTIKSRFPGQPDIALRIEADGVGRVRAGNDGGIGFEVATPASTVNRLVVSGAATGNAPSVAAEGDDANIDVTLTPKGTGRVRMGTYVAGALAVAGHIEIKDAGGTIRRVLIG